MLALERYGSFGCACQKKRKAVFSVYSEVAEGTSTRLTGTVASGPGSRLFQEAAKRSERDIMRRAGFYFDDHKPYLIRVSATGHTSIADSFYLEGTTSALVQAAQAY